ncbi:MAG: amidohydrolase family protein, partial [Eggerthellaceae bacterium]|nr:amidohydrolase family protein [Eggerthellaceae bacterium]
PRWNESGTLFEGIQIFHEYKPLLTPEDVKDRAMRALRLMASHGIQFVRGHVDVSDPNLTALEPLLEVRREAASFVDVQLVAFPQEGILSFPNGETLLRRAAAAGVDAIGGCPHIEFNQGYGAQSVRILMDIACEYDLLVDVHCDEIDDPNSRNLEALATLALERDMGARVTASHTTAMGSYPDAYASKLINLLVRSGMNIVSNPMVNMHLGGRFDTYPKRRGLTRVKELDAAGVNVAFGEDDLQDPWHPMANGDMMDPVWMGVYAAQLMGYEQLQGAYRFVTHNAARVLGRQDDYGIVVGNTASCVLVDAPNFYEALRTHAPVTHSIRKGKVIATTEPARTMLHA